MTYRYETHLHTYPVSKCGKKTVEESLLFYQKLNYRGVFITNHFIDGNINMVNGVNRAGGKAKLTVYPDVEHNAWDYAYKDPEFWNWMLMQKK